MIQHLQFTRVVNHKAHAISVGTTLMIARQAVDQCALLYLGSKQRPLFIIQDIVGGPPPRPAAFERVESAERTPS